MDANVPWRDATIEYFRRGARDSARPIKTEAQRRIMILIKEYVCTLIEGKAPLSAVLGTMLYS